MKVSIDTYDIAVCVALWGGFVYGVWAPGIILILWLIIADWFETRAKIDAWIDDHKPL